MKKPFVPVLAFAFLFLSDTAAQTKRSTDPITRPRSVAALENPQAKRVLQVQEPAAPRATDEQKVAPQQPALARESSANRLSPNKVRARIDEAKRLLKSRPHPTAMTSPSLVYVTLAAMVPDNSQLHLVRIPKETFLKKGSEIPSISNLGLQVTVRILRANGVNTAVTIIDERNRSLVPLVVEYPIERRGKFLEMAYYTSAHPALLSPDLTKAGQLYVNSMVELAAKRLKSKGFNVSSHLVEIAKRLCIVEHVDHDRFRNDNRIALYDEIYSLYALNELDTYRFSVSSAGAGGMVQMIPWTYRYMRERHPSIGLNPDFVLGMRNHGNALEAMLLYMQDTWSDLVAHKEVQAALDAKQIMPHELMAAGYNSNAAKIPGYIRRGGTTGWKILIPRETQIYLQIYHSFETLSRAKANHARKAQNRAK
jgi:hypothetical protein